MHKPRGVARRQPLEQLLHGGLGGSGIQGAVQVLQQHPQVGQAVLQDKSHGEALQRGEERRREWMFSRCKGACGLYSGMGAGRWN